MARMWLRGDVVSFQLSLSACIAEGELDRSKYHPTFPIQNKSGRPVVEEYGDANVLQMPTPRIVALRDLACALHGLQFHRNVTRYLKLK